MRPLVPGLSLERSFEVSEADLASALGNRDVEVVSTPHLIWLIEETCRDLLLPYYEPGEVSVGARVAVDHLAPARPGRPVAVRAELLEQAGRRCRFGVEVRQGVTRVMAGEHLRALVDGARFGGAAPDAEVGPPPEAARALLDFWFDFNSPWCWLAVERLPEIAARHGAEIRWRPVHIARLIERIGGRRPLEENAAFVSWYREDLRDWAELMGLELRYHPEFPLRPARALRLALKASEAGAAERVVGPTFRAYWSEGRDISDAGVLGELAEAAGLGPSAVAAALDDRALKERLAANLEEAAATGIFGLPIVTLDGKRFFGQDRLALLDRALGRRRNEESP